MISLSSSARASVVVGLIWLVGGVNHCLAQRIATDERNPPPQVARPSDPPRPAEVRAVRVHMTFMGSGVTDASVMQVMARLIEDLVPWPVALDLSYERDFSDRPGVVRRLSDVPSPETVASSRLEETLDVYVAEVRIDEDGNGVPDFTAAPLIARRADGSTAGRGVLIDRSAVSPHNAELTYQIGLTLGLWHSPDDPGCHRLQRRRKPSAVADRQHRVAPIVVAAKEER